MRNSAGIIADGDRDRDQPENLKRISDGDKASREHWTRIYKSASFRPRPSHTEQRPEILSRSEQTMQPKRENSKPSSRTE